MIQTLFRHPGPYQKPEHLLSHGFRRARPGQNALDNIPGLVAQFPNHNVRTLKDAPWTEVLGLLGAHGDEIMMRLLFDCGIFAPIDARKGIYYQLSGMISWQRLKYKSYTFQVYHCRSSNSRNPHWASIRRKQVTAKAERSRKVKGPTASLFLVAVCCTAGLGIAGKRICTVD